MQKRKPWLVILGSGLGLWLVLGLGVFWLQSTKPTVNDVLVLIRKSPTSQDRIAGLLARLEPDARHRVLMHPDTATWFGSLPRQAQSSFLETSLPPQWNEFMSGSKSWSVGRLERLLAPSLDELEALQAGSRSRFEQIIVIPSPEALRNAGVSALVSEPDLQARFTTKPLLERIQRNSQLGK